MFFRIADTFFFQIKQEPTRKIRGKTKTKISMSKTKAMIQMGTIKDKYVAKIKRIGSKRSALARLHGLKAGDVLRDLRGVPMTGMTFENTQQLLEDMHYLATPFSITFIRKLHSFRSGVQQDVKKIMAEHQKSVKTLDKFIATLVTLLYLLVRA